MSASGEPIWMIDGPGDGSGDEPCDPAAQFAAWVRPHWTQMHQLASRRCGPQLSKDVLAQALASAWLRRAEFDTEFEAGSNAGSNAGSDPAAAFLLSIVTEHAGAQRDTRDPAEPGGDGPLPDLDRMVAVAISTSAGPARRPALIAAAGAAALIAIAGLTIAAHRSDDSQHGAVLTPTSAATASSPSPSSAPSASSAPTSHRPSGVPANVDLQGGSERYAGNVSWNDAVLDPSDPRVLYVSADLDSLGLTRVCGIASVRVTVRQDAGAVRVIVSGYGNPLPAGTSCAPVAHAPRRQKVVLIHPLGSRSLLDAAGLEHAPLNPSTVPRITALPAGCAAQPVDWTETPRIATRLCASRDGGLRVNLAYAPANTYDITLGKPVGTRSGPFRVGAVTAIIWHDVQRDDDGWTVRWDPDAAHEIVLTLDADPAAAFTRNQVLAIARSVR